MGIFPTLPGSDDLLLQVAVGVGGKLLVSKADARA